MKAELLSYGNYPEILYGFRVEGQHWPFGGKLFTSDVAARKWLHWHHATREVDTNVWTLCLCNKCHCNPGEGKSR